MTITDRFARPRVAVLGATGCVGRQVCAAFADADYEVIAVARRFAPQIAGYRYRSLDVGGADVPRLAEMLTAERAQVVVNATGGWGSTEREMTYSHVDLVERLVEAVAEVPQRPRLVHVGTIHEYGPVAHGTVIDETVVPAPRTMYARTKLAGSEAVLRATAAGDVDGVVLRLVNVFGPHPSPASFLGALATRLRTVSAGQQLELSIAEAQRDYVDARDAAAAVLRAAHSGVVGEVINIGRGTAIGLRELVYALVDAAGLDAGAVRELGTAVTSKGGDWTLASTAKARELLGWTAAVPVAESVRAMLGALPVSV
ncbi:NAD(P)-dependent oxidoreductase [Allokutzneria sp. A3M-2-11 16]|uniref:NAD-dependent epimerase/dehydratase family protein n=1 Tax=Allokutzneria sp. A3M-2-11 16 TaxID=2962043 RepID=UPI0020B7A1DF|nr:NAD(P)-dependent oxidoreductase [Allokutzneria sp. A3M-2-11 16]MCP3800850.1 NAD(P)-dependent oxidoreductase [Allokutzneria sp. A3M-2-11 16]